MTKVQILENESFIEKADFENYEVWLLNETSEKEIDERIINIQELTESLKPSALKLPRLLTLIYENIQRLNLLMKMANWSMLNPVLIMKF
jgi:hypothetical protein